MNFYTATTHSDAYAPRTRETESAHKHTMFNTSQQFVAHQSPSNLIYLFSRRKMIWKYAPYKTYVRACVFALCALAFLLFICASMLSVHATPQKWREKKNTAEQMINDGTNAGEY